MRARRGSVISALILVLTSAVLDGCVVAPPTGPDVAVMPGPNKTFPQFQQDDATCRGYASQSSGGVNPAQAANQSAVGSAAIGTVLGAAAGAAIGAAAGNPGAGAAIGAGAGLVTGTAAGAGNAAQSSADLQQRYDVAYAQCMSAQGNKLPEAPAAPVTYTAPVGYPAPYYYAPPPPYYYGPPPVYYGAPAVIIGGWGRGWGGGRRW